MTYRKIYSATYSNKENLDQSSYIIVESSMLSTEMMEGQMITFKITNPRTNESVFAVEKEFTAEQGTIIAPYWMMDKIGVDEGETILIESVILPPATRAVFQPRTKEFNEIREPRVVLEKELRNHPCLTQGSTIQIKFAGEIYQLYILKTEPTPAVRIRDIDVVCEFAPLEDNFKHNWNDPDTDSSDESEEDRYYNTLEKPKQRVYRHSTLESREKDLKTSRRYVGVRTFQEGQEILPPVAQEKPKKEKIKGTWHNLKNETGEIKERHYDDGSSVLKEQKKDTKDSSDSLFIGKARFL